MNTIKTLLVVALITFSSQVSAFTGPPEEGVKTVSQQIETLLKYSEILIHDDIAVTIKFKLNENNEIILVSNDSNNYDISKFIKTRLKLKELSIDKKDIHSLYAVPIKFLSTVR